MTMTDSTNQMQQQAQQALRSRRWDEERRELAGAVERLRAEDLTERLGKPRPTVSHVVGGCAAR